jgi:hypothetical protein
MDTIKKYFTQSVVDNVNKSMDENDESSVCTIYNKTQDEDVSFIIIKERTKNVYCLLSSIDDNFTIF